MNQDNFTDAAVIPLRPSHYKTCMKEKYDVETYEDHRGFFSYRMTDVFFITEVYVDKKYLGASRFFQKKWEEIARAKNYSQVFLSFAVNAKNFDKSLRHSLALGFKFLKIENQTLYLVKEI